MLKFKAALLSIGIMLGVGVFALSPVVGAVDPFGKACADDPSNVVCKGVTTDKVDSYLKNGINIALFVLGILSVVMIIVGGFTYITSGGDSANVTKAKNTIMFSIIGLVVAALAAVIVNFVLTSFKIL